MSSSLVSSVSAEFVSLSACAHLPHASLVETRSDASSVARVAALAAPVRPDGLRRAARPGHGAAASSQALGAASTCVPATVQQPVLKLSSLPALVLTVNENHSKSYQDPGW